MSIRPVATSHGYVANDRRLINLVSSTVATALRELAAEAPVSLRVSGDCMAPLLRDGATIRVVRSRYYWPGDAIIVHAPDGRLLVHRLLGCYLKGKSWRWLTGADTAMWPDMAVPTERIVGKVCGGDCSPALIRPPVTHRWNAFRRYISFALCVRAPPR